MVTQILLSKHPAIPVELVGQKAVIRDGKYDDNYLSRINQLYPLEDILGARKDGIAQGEWNDLNHFTMGSPLENLEGEQVLNAVLYASANAGLWQPKIIDVGALTDTHIRTAEEYLDRVRTISPTYNKGMIDGGTIFGISVAQRGGFVIPTQLENRVIVLPHQVFIEYCVQKKK